jgi:ribosomal protein S18 acetylase RimI-like enzyme
MASDGYVIRSMRRNEIDLAINWAAAEGWNPGLHDAEPFYTADPEGFLVGELGGEPIATISAVRYGANFGFMGFYIVRPAFRGKGYGLRLCNVALAQLSGRNIGLDGVVEQQDNYRKSGFSLAYRNVRYQGRCGKTPEKAGVIDLADVPFAIVADYDASFFPDDRRGFLKSWLVQPGTRSRGVMRDGRLTGFGVIRPCRSGYKIGPLFADDAQLAEDLYQALQADLPETAPVYLDVPEVNEAAVALAGRHGMQVVFETARMYSGSFPDLPMQRLFGVTSFELG